MARTRKKPKLLTVRISKKALEVMNTLPWGLKSEVIDTLIVDNRKSITKTAKAA